MNAPQMASYALAFATNTLEDVMSDVTEKEAHWLPPGLTSPIGALYLHTVYGVDAVIQRMFQDKPPLWNGEGWAAKLGVEVDLDMTAEWARGLRLDLAGARQYAAAVFKAAEEYVATLGEADMDRFIASGMSESTTLGQLLMSFVVWHIDVHCGEISALKGMQGMKGYPF